MIATKVDDVYDVTPPPSVESMLDAFAIVVSFGFNGVSTVLECLGMPRYTHTLVVYIVTPFVLALLILLVVLTGKLCRPHSGPSLMQTAVPLMLKLIFLAYPLVTTAAFDAFACHTFTQSKWLKVDVSIQCGTTEHAKVIGLAWVAIVLYPIGLLALIGGLLFAARHAILANKPTALSRATAFLHREYEVHLFWWELVEMLRRFVLVGLMVLAQGSMLQLVMGALLSAVFLLFQVQAAPYRSSADDFLASAVSFGLVAIFLCSISFKEYEIFGAENIERRMSIEQEEYYIVDQAFLTFIMLASVFGAILLSFVLFLIQFAAEGRRLRREALASKARRLRFKADGYEVQAPELTSSYSDKGLFHLFLSHVWGTGQDQMRVVKQRLLEMVPELRVFLGACLPRTTPLRRPCASCFAACSPNV